MYKKINAAKNNNLKKASIFVAVAALASSVVFMGLERLGGNNTAVTRADWSPFSNFGLRGGDLYRGLNGFGKNWLKSSWSNNKYNKYRQGTPISSLSVNQKSNADLMISNLRLIIDQIGDRLGDLGNMPETVEEYDLNKVGSAVKKAAKYIFKSVDYKRFKDVKFPTDTVEGIYEGVGKYAEALRKFQRGLFEYIQYMSTALELEQFKNQEKLNALKKADIDKDVKCPSDLLEAANITRIREKGGAALEKAKEILKNAKVAFLNANTFGETKVEDRWHLTKKWYEKVSPECRHLMAVLQTILYFNQQINAVNKVILASEVITALQRAFVDIVARGGEATNAILKNKSALFMLLAGIGRTELLILPLALATTNGSKGFAGVNFKWLDKVKGVADEFVSVLADATTKNEKSIKDLTGCLRNFIEEGVRGEKFETVRYDLREVLVGAVGLDVAKVLLSQFDTTVSQVYSDKLVEQFRKGEKQGKIKTKADFKELVSKAANSFAAKKATHSFVGNGGQLNPFDVNLSTIQGDSIGGAHVSTEVIKDAANILGTPEAIRNTALVKLMTSRYKSYRYDMASSLKNNLDTWFSMSGFDSEVNNVIGDIAAICRDSAKVAEKIHEIKGMKVSNKENVDESVFDRKLTNLLSLDGGNVNTDKNAVKVRGKLVEISKLPSTVNKIIVTLCPKTSKDREKEDPNVELPPIDVKNGRAVVDLSGYLKSIGNYELHWIDAATGEFQQKEKFFYGADELEPMSVCEFRVDEDAHNGYFDFTTAEAILNSDKSVTYRIKRKPNVSISAASPITCVCFEKDSKDIPLEKHKFAMCLDADGETYSFTSTKSQKGTLELHIYAGEVEESSFKGKIIADTTKTTAIKAKSKASISNMVNKNFSGNGNAQKASAYSEKLVKFVLPGECLADEIKVGDEIEYEIVERGGKSVVEGTTKVSRVTWDLDRGWYDTKIECTATIKVPRDNNEYYVRILNDICNGDARLNSDNFTADKLGSNTKLRFSEERSWDY